MQEANRRLGAAKLSFQLGHVVAIATGLIILAILIPLRLIRGCASQVAGCDYLNIYTASKALILHKLDLLWNPDTFQTLILEVFGSPVADHSWSYPPSIFLLIWPIGLFSYTAGFLVWAGLTFGLMCAAFWIFLRPATPTAGWLLVLAVALAPASVFNLMAGQTGYLTAAFFVGGLVLLPTRPLAAGFLFGLLTVKPHLGILIPIALVAGGHWRTIATAAATAIALVVVSGAVWGVQVWESYVSQVAPYQRVILENPGGLGVLISPSIFKTARFFGISADASYVLQMIGAFSTMLAVWFVWRQPKFTERYRNIVLLCGVPLTTPYLHTYDLTILVPPILILISWHRSIWTHAILLLAWWLPIIGAVLTFFVGLPNGPTVLIALFLVAVCKDGERQTGHRPDSMDQPSARPA